MLNLELSLKQCKRGGHQEHNKRAGTENVASIVAMGKAIELIYRDFYSYNEKQRYLRDFYISEIEHKIEDVKLNGDRFDRLPRKCKYIIWRGGCKSIALKS